VPPSNNRVSVSAFDYYEPISIENKRNYDQHAHWRPQPVVCFSHLSAPWVDLFRRRWLSERSYADLVALCQFLPGPASSQVDIALGLSQSGYAGALAA